MAAKGMLCKGRVRELAAESRAMSQSLSIAMEGGNASSEDDGRRQVTDRGRVAIERASSGRS